MRHKQDVNGGVVDGVTDTFDAATNLVFDFPNVSAAGIGRPSIEMPAYYDLWAQATGDPFWTGAATAARAYWQRSANPSTGLTPVRATFAGVPVAGSDNFQPEAYRAALNMTLDRIWSGAAATPGPSARAIGCSPSSRRRGSTPTARRIRSTARRCSARTTIRGWWR